LDGWRSAVCSVTKCLARPWRSRQRLKPRSDFPGRDAQLPASGEKRVDCFHDPLVQWFGDNAFAPHRVERRLVAVGKAVVQRRVMLGRQRRHRLRQAQPDDAARRFMRRRGEAVAREAAVHGQANVGAAVHQRPVAIEDGKAGRSPRGDGHGAAAIRWNATVSVSSVLPVR
jgi:hypothetical protein